MTLPRTHDLDSHWQQWRTTVNTELDRFVPVAEPRTLWESIRYSVTAGGKRLRPFLVIATMEALVQDPRPAIPAACAIELIHTFSLIHDDLPALDNDEFRRGVPSNHSVYGEATAILAGDALQALAFRLLSRDLRASYPASLCLDVVEQLSDTAVNGLACGQAADLAATGKPIGEESLRYIHDHKTGSLIRCAVRVGTVLGSATPQQTHDLDAYAMSLGLAFQIADDVLDAVGSAMELGKTPGKDERDGKATYAKHYGISRAMQSLREEGLRAEQALASWGEEATMLRLLVRHVVRQCQTGLASWKLEEDPVPRGSVRPPDGKS